MPTAPRFFIDAAIAPGERIELPMAVAHHALRVLRLAPGASIVLFNGRGGEYTATLESRGATGQAFVTGHAALERESPVAIRLVQAWISNDKLDWVIEKSVELGAHSIVMVPTRRSVTKPGAERLTRRIERLREIAVAACCQCGRNRIPAISAEPDLVSALRNAATSATERIVLEPSASEPLIGDKSLAADIALAIGPEGGFDDQEIQLAAQIGYAARRLGPRILRTETASVAALAALQSFKGDFRKSSS